MYIKRDEFNLHFGRPRRRRRRGGWIAFLLLVAGLALVVVWQFDAIQAQVITLISGEAPTPTQAAASLAQEAYWDYLDGDVDAATAGFAAAVAQFPEDINYLYEYGRLLVLQSLGTEALQVAERAITIAPTDPRGYTLKVQALVLQDLPDEAVPVGLAATEIDPNFAPTYAALALAYSDSGRWLQGVETAQHAVDLDPQDVDARRAYAYALTWIGEREAAIQQLEAATELAPNLDFLYFELAMNYRAQQRQADAIQAYEQVLSHNPTSLQALLRLCETYYGLREDATAQDYCEQALIVDPNYAPAWRQVGMVYYVQLQYTRAVGAFERCVELGSEDIQCWYVRGLALYYLNRCDEGVPLLQEALQRTESEQILGVIRQGLRLCAGEDPAVVTGDGAVQEEGDTVDEAPAEETQPTPTPTATPPAEENMSAG